MRTTLRKHYFERWESSACHWRCHNTQWLNYLFLGKQRTNRDCVRVCSVMSDSLWLHGLELMKAPLSMGFPRQEFWSGLPFHSPGDLPDPGIKPKSPAALALAGGFFTTEHIENPIKTNQGQVKQAACDLFIGFKILKNYRELKKYCYSLGWYLNMLFTYFTNKKRHQILRELFRKMEMFSH